MDTLLILGSTGLVGGLVADGLAALEHPVRRAARAPAASPNTVRFDLTDPSTFEAALSGVGGVFLIARPGDDAPQHVAAPLIEAMTRAGTRFVVHLSAMGTEQRPEFGLRKLELALEASGLSVTHLRPNWFMQTFLRPPLGPLLQRTRTLALPAGDAGVSFIDAQDIADVAIRALTDPGVRGQGFTLTGPAAVSHAQVVSEIGRATGLTFTYRAQSEDEARESLSAAHFPPAHVERLIGFYRLLRSGACAPVTDTVETLLGRPARGFGAFCDAHRSAWLAG